MTDRSKKIPCTVGILTLNSADGLRACLESLKDFDEIIVCDGNSTDGTGEVAKEFGAKVIKQYETDETNLMCVKDKAAVRQKNMEAASHPWYFFMDADDTLSPEAVEEIRTIVTDPKPKHFVYRMPTRIFINGKLVKYEATYPSYQTRLVHRSVNAHFKNPVHDHLVWDDKQFPAGTMQSFYNFHWSEKRVNNYWGYLGRYADWEIDTAPTDISFGHFLHWTIYRRLKTIAGYILYRLPKMYLLHGFRDSMPLSIELTIVRYHFRILRRSIAQYFKRKTFVTVFLETLRGKDITRTLSNLGIRDKECFGKILDIGSADGRSSHYRFLRINKWKRITTIDIDPKAKPDLVLNLEKERIPVADNTYDFVFAFNIIEHLYKREEILKDVHRVLRAGGELVGVVPFLVNVHPDPYDYVRLTRQGLEGLFKDAGFTEISIKPVGTGPILAGYYQTEFILPRIIRLIFLPFVFCGDALLRRLARKLPLKERYPLAYVFYAKK